MAHSGPRGTPGSRSRGDGGLRRHVRRLLALAACDADVPSGPRLPRSGWDRQ